MNIICISKRGHGPFFSPFFGLFLAFFLVKKSDMCYNYIMRRIYNNGFTD